MKKLIKLLISMQITSRYRYQKGITPYTKSRKVRYLSGFPAPCLLFELNLRPVVCHAIGQYLTFFTASDELIIYDENVSRIFLYRFRTGPSPPPLFLVWQYLNHIFDLALQALADFIQDPELHVLVFSHP